MQPTCSALATALKLDQAAAAVALEDSVRAMPDAPASALLAAIEPRLRRYLGGGAWRLVAAMPSANVVGRLHIERSLSAVQDHAYDEATVLLVDQVRCMRAGESVRRDCERAVPPASTTLPPHAVLPPLSVCRCSRVCCVQQASRLSRRSFHRPTAIMAVAHCFSARPHPYTLVTRLTVKRLTVPSVLTRLMLQQHQSLRPSCISGAHVACTRDLDSHRGHGVDWWRRGLAAGLRCGAVPATDRRAESRRAARARYRSLCRVLLRRRAPGCDRPGLQRPAGAAANGRGHRFLLRARWRRTRRRRPARAACSAPHERSCQAACARQRSVRRRRADGTVDLPLPSSV